MSELAHRQNKEFENLINRAMPDVSNSNSAACCKIKDDEIILYLEKDTEGIYRKHMLLTTECPGFLVFTELHFERDLTYKVRSKISHNELKEMSRNLLEFFKEFGYPEIGPSKIGEEVFNGRLKWGEVVEAREKALKERFGMVLKEREMEQRAAREKIKKGNGRKQDSRRQDGDEDSFEDLKMSSKTTTRKKRPGSASHSRRLKMPGAYPHDSSSDLSDQYYTADEGPH